MTDNTISRRRFLQYGSLAASAMATPMPAFASRSLGFAEYLGHDAIGLAALVAKGEVSPVELLDIAIKRTAEVNPTINAIVLPHYELARKSIAQGLPDGPLRGVPFLLKDLHLKLNGTVTSYGSRLFKDYVASYDSTLVERYRRAGLVIFGKTASPEFGGTATTESKLYGRTRNPWNLEYTSGGSSGGSSAAIAAGILPAANASDGGGSIRIPASNCGLFGIKPTRGRVPLGPHHFEGAGGRSVVHALSRSVRDSALLLDISRGMAPYEPYTAPPVERDYLEEVARPVGKLRIGLLRQTHLGLPVHADCLAAVDAAARLCSALGHDVEETALRFDAAEYYRAVQVSSATYTAMTVHARERELGRKATPEDLETRSWNSVQMAAKFSAEDLAAARETSYRVGASMSELMREYDVLLSPTQATPPYKLGVLSMSNPDQEEYVAAATNASVFTMVYNVSGQPAMSVPLHWNGQGLPIGVMFAGAFGDEATLFRLAGQLEQAQPWFGRLPVLA